jgi:TonB family protein
MAHRRRRTVVHPLAWLALAALGAGRAEAQSFVGRVVEGDSVRRPIAGVAVALTDSAGREVATGTTNALGLFYLDAPAPGRYAVVLTRPGGAPYSLEPREVAAADEVQVEYVLPPDVAVPADTAEGAGGTVYRETEVDRPATPVVGNPGPRYPVGARNIGRGAELLVQFVVDSTGRAEPSTFRVLRNDGDADFERAVREVLPRWRFMPARLGGRPVRQLVQLPFTFRAAGAPPSPVEPRQWHGGP